MSRPGARTHNAFGSWVSFGRGGGASGYSPAAGCCWAQLGEQGAARCGRVRSVGRSRVQASAAGGSRLQQGVAARRGLAKEGAARRSIFGIRRKQLRPAAGSCRARLAAARCGRVQSDAAGCSWVQQGGAGCWQSLVQPAVAWVRQSDVGRRPPCV